MNEPTPNDNDTAAGLKHREPDAHGQAALLLVESLIHALVARNVISVADAIEIVEIAADVKEEIAAELGDSPLTKDRSLRLLKSIAMSLGPDLPRL